MKTQKAQPRQPEAQGHRSGTGTEGRGKKKKERGVSRSTLPDRKHNNDH